MFLISVGNRAGLAPWLDREILLRSYGLGAALSEDAAGPNNSSLLDSRAGSWFSQGMLERDRMSRSSFLSEWRESMWGDRESQTLVGSGARDSLLTMRLPGDLWQPGYNLWGLGIGSLVVNHCGSLQFWSLGQTLPDLLDFDLIATPTL